MNLKDSPKFMCSCIGPGLMVLFKDDLIMWALRWTIEVSSCREGDTRSIKVQSI